MKKVLLIMAASLAMFWAQPSAAADSAGIGGGAPACMPALLHLG